MHTTQTAQIPSGICRIDTTVTVACGASMALFDALSRKYSYEAKGHRNFTPQFFGIIRKLIQGEKRRDIQVFRETNVGRLTNVEKLRCFAIFDSPYLSHG